MAVNRSYSPLRAVDTALDNTNRLILAELQDDARVTLAELGRRVGLSAPAVAERLQRMEGDGTIRAYRAEVDPRSLGYTLGAVLRIRPSPRQIHKVAGLGEYTPGVRERQRIPGQDCFFRKLRLRDADRLQEVIDRFVPYGQTTSSI